MKSIILYATLLAITRAQSIESGQCIEVQVVQKFDIPAYAGLWNEIYSYPVDFRPTGKCVSAKYTDNGSGINITNTMVVDKLKFTISGSAKPAEGSNGEAKLITNFPMGENKFTDYWVLSTDYKNYSLVYACTNISKTTKRVSSWILSREKTLSDNSRKIIEPVVKAAQLDWNIYKETDQSEAGCKTWN